MKHYYDVLFSDLEGTQAYYRFIEQHATGTTILEFACGTGDLLNLLSQKYEVMGVDLDEKMIQQALAKYPHLSGKIIQGNFLEKNSIKKTETLICVGDSLNYMTSINELETFVDVASQSSNHIIVDFHHPYRLIEFKDDYIEEGKTEMFEYAYTIVVNDDFLIHTINFLDGSYDQITQWVFNPEVLVSSFAKKGYASQLFTDFDYPGVLNQGEKVMAIFTKKEQL